MPARHLPSRFLRFLAARPENGEEVSSHLPSMAELGAELGISIAKLREQIEVARAWGFVEVRPRTGIRRLPYQFFPAVRSSLLYAVSVDWQNFEKFSGLRNHIEAAYWQEAVALLTPEDHETLRQLMLQAWEKLQGEPIKIPHFEHRELHLTIYRRLENPFVLGMLEAYWEAYEAVGLNVYADYQYLQEVWGYHQKMVDAICQGDLDAGYRALVRHTDLLYHRSDTTKTGETSSTVVSESLNETVPHP